MHGFFRLFGVPLGRLAGAQEGEESMLEVELHKMADSQATVAEEERAGECLIVVLAAVARDMCNVRGLQHLDHTGD
jgi:hypothetical protein